jgi:hypothetical protein
MAANNDPAVKRTARMADAWFINPHATIDTIRRQMAVYRAELKAAGKGLPRELPVIKLQDRIHRSIKRIPTCHQHQQIEVALQCDMARNVLTGEVKTNSPIEPKRRA